MVLEIAQRSTSRSDFKRRNSVAYRKALQWGIVEALFPIEIVRIDKIKPVRKKVVERVVSFDAVEIEEDARWIMNDRDCDNLKHDAARDYKGEALEYYWQMIRKHGG
jgi:hypothetical protein